MALPSTEQQLYHAIAILTAVEHRLFLMFIKTPQSRDPLSEDPAIFQPDEVDGLINLWVLVQDSATQLVESDLRRRWAEAVNLLMWNRDLRLLDDVLAEVIGSTGSHSSLDPFSWHRLVQELRELGESSSDSARRRK